MAAGPWDIPAFIIRELKEEVPAQEHQQLVKPKPILNLEDIL
jgi:hypothetical protein